MVTQSAMRGAAFVAAALLLGGCWDGASDATGRTSVSSSGPGARLAGVSAPARVSSKSGEILILEEDGSVTAMDLDSEAGRDAFLVTEADLAQLNANLDLDFGRIAPLGRATPRRQTAQEKAIEDFAARTQPALPTWVAGTIVEPEMFIGAKIDTLGEGRNADLVEVTVNLRRGVDADIGFAYATCALAGWAKDNKIAYGRHIRTLQDTRNGKLLVGSAFMLSDSRPLGLRLMETEDTLRECKTRGIPAA